MIGKLVFAILTRFSGSVFILVPAGVFCGRANKMPNSPLLAFLPRAFPDCKPVSSPAVGIRQVCPGSGGQAVIDPDTISFSQFKSKFPGSPGDLLTRCQPAAYRRGRIAGIPGYDFQFIPFRTKN
jgi:hypothetical protein